MHFALEDLSLSFKEDIKYLDNMLNIRKYLDKSPISIEKDTLAAKALSIMNSKKITSLCVHSNKNKNKTVGFIHIHNILNANIN